MALMDRIDALPDDMKAICASFAYGYTEKGDEAWHALAFRVGADVYRYTLPYWYLAVFEPWDYGSDYIGEVCGVWQEVGIFGWEEDYTRAFAEHVGDKVWKGGLMS
jgi:hypothetical protein